MKNERGFTLLEVTIAIALLGIIAIAFVSALFTGSMVLLITDERNTANNLAESQMEHVKNQAYIDYSVEEHEVYQLIIPPSGYEIEPIDVELLDPENDGDTDDDGIQKITITINHRGKEVITLEGYKVDR